MNKKRFTNIGGVEDFFHLVFDNENVKTLSVKQTVEKLNEQQATIEHLNKECMGLVSMFEEKVEENEQLRAARGNDAKEFSALFKQNLALKRENEALVSNIKWFAHQLEKLVLK